MVTYEQLFDTLRREKSRDELQVLEPEFYKHAHVFLNEKKSAATSDMTVASQKAQIEYQNAVRILKELYDRRERKLLTLAMHKTRTDTTIVDNEALLPEERKLFDALVQTLNDSRREILHMEGIPVEPRETSPEPVAKELQEETAEEPAVDEPEVQATPEPQGEETVTVTFTAAIPKFVGKDMTVYGPFEEGQEASLPSSVATILVEKGRASTS